MKKWMAFFLLVVYSFTSVSASVAVHPCGDKAKAPQHHQKVAGLQKSSSCNHQAFHTSTDNCCTGSATICSAKTDDNLHEVPSYKTFNHQPAVFNAGIYCGPARPFSSLPVSALSFAAPWAIPKIRLHLYNRFLLI